MSDASRSRIAGLSLRFVIAGIVVAVIGLLLTRFGVLHFRSGLIGVAGGMLVVGAGTLLGIIGIIRGVMGKPGLAPSAIAAVAGIVILAVPVSNALGGGSVPPIHDISTDLETPPDFVSVVALRGEDSNPLTRTEPADLADQQRNAYPQLQTLIVEDDIATVFAAALEEATAQGWDIVDAAEPENGEAGRIEATDTTLLFGFKDDVVIRIADDGPDRTLVDMRSVSRVGISDLGKNAARIEGFFDGLKGRL